jgi:hypothetical protein
MRGGSCRCGYVAAQAGTCRTRVRRWPRTSAPVLSEAERSGGATTAHGRFALTGLHIAAHVHLEPPVGPQSAEGDRWLRDEL